MTSYLALGYLCRGYVNEDWPEDYGDVWIAVDTFVQEERDKAQAVPGEIYDLLQKDLNEEELRSELRELSCNYWPYATDSTYREWLGQVSERITRKLHEQA